MKAISFDFGQTLVEIDCAFLAARLAERGREADPARLEAALPAAWKAYDDAIRRGVAGHPWTTFMAALLEGGGLVEGRDELSTWLFSEQPRRNLWRRPVPGMTELAREARLRGLRVGIGSNSEGKLEALVADLGWLNDFEVVADSGVLGVEKPDPRFFAWLAERLGAAPSELVHVGDSLAADVEGALAFGARAVLFDRRRAEAPPELPVGVPFARSAAEARAALVRLGVF